MALPAPAHHDAMRRVHLLIFTTCDVFAIDIDPVAPAGTRIQLGSHAHPFHEPAAVRQIGEHRFRRRLDSLRDLDGAGKVLNHGGGACPGFPAQPAA